jgi:hypothetical protein
MGTVDQRVDVYANTAVLDLVVADVGVAGLHAEPDLVVGDDVPGDRDVGLVVHANSDKIPNRRVDSVVGDDGIFRADGKDTIVRAVQDGVVPDFGILGTDNGDVQAIEAMDFKAFDKNVLDEGVDRDELAMLAVLDISELGIGANDTDTCLRVVADKTGTAVCNE